MGPRGKQQRLWIRLVLGQVLQLHPLALAQAVWPASSARVQRAITLPAALQDSSALAVLQLFSVMQLMVDQSLVVGMLLLVMPTGSLGDLDGSTAMGTSTSRAVEEDRAAIVHYPGILPSSIAW